MMTNRNNTVIYTGVTSDLIKRAYEHRHKLIDGFTKRYNVNKIVYYEIFEDITEAISREKQIKGGSRAKKVGLINRSNPELKDLFDEIASSAPSVPPRNDDAKSTRNDEGKLNA